jgi:hypothetical protein
MRKSVILLALFLLPIAFSSTQAKGLYIGASVGAAMTNGIDDEEGVELDDSGTGWEALAGFQFAGPIGAELAYVDLGKVSAEGLGFTEGLKSHGVQFSAVATVPANSPLAAQARFGGFAWSQDVEFADDEGAIEDSESGTTMCAGFGVRYNLKSLEHLGLTAKWTRYFDVGESSELDRDFFALGATWSFGSNDTAE